MIEMDPYQIFDLDNEGDRKIIANWGLDLIAKIYEVANKCYPNVDIWCDTGSTWNVCMNILDRVIEDHGKKKRRKLKLTWVEE